MDFPLSDRGYSAGTRQRIVNSVPMIDDDRWLILFVCQLNYLRQICKLEPWLQTSSLRDLDDYSIEKHVTRLAAKEPHQYLWDHLRSLGSIPRNSRLPVLSARHRALSLQTGFLLDAEPTATYFFPSFLVFTCFYSLRTGAIQPTTGASFHGVPRWKRLAISCSDMFWYANQIRQLSAKMGPRVKRLRQKFCFVRLC